LTVVKWDFAEMSMDYSVECRICSGSHIGLVSYYLLFSVTWICDSSL